ncbi:MAG: isochorismatase family cysteine hydrolase [Gemmatimonadaceae bacterium]
MQALLVVDAQNEFSVHGQRTVPNHDSAVAAIAAHVEAARRDGRPIAWVRHHNKPTESPAFVPGSWGAALSEGFGARHDGASTERLFTKEVFGAFTNTELEQWLRDLDVSSVLITGFYTHMCVSTSCREALVRGFDVVIDPDATGARALESALLGSQSADEVRRTALLQVVNMGATLWSASAVQATCYVTTSA